jgi:hypothetical protein
MTSQGEHSRKQENGNHADVPNPPVAHTGAAAPRDEFAQFAWQKLNDLDRSFVEFSDKYGRVDERLKSIERQLEKAESTLSEVHDAVRAAKIWVAAICGVFTVVGGVVYAVYQVVAPYISFGSGG